MPLPQPFRVLALGGGLPAYFEASEDEKHVHFEVRVGRPFWAVDSDSRRGRLKKAAAPFGDRSGSIGSP